MNRTWTFAWKSTATAVAGSLAIMGCAWPRSMLSPRTATPPIAETPPPNPQAQPETEALRPDDTTLAAIETFLARTTDFGPPPSATDSKSAASPTGPQDATTKASADPNGAQAVESNADRALANMQLALPEPLARRAAVARPIVMGVTVRTPSLPAAPIAPPAHVPNAPANAVAQSEAFSWDRVLQQLDAEAQSKQDFRSAFAALLTRLALGREIEGVAVGRDLPSASRDVLSRLIRSIAAVRDAVASTDVSATPALHAIDDLRGALANRADLEISSVELCRKVLTFGVYDALLETELTAGRSVPAIVYCEVRNFQSEADAEGKFVTRLSTRLEVLSVDGVSVLEKSEPEVVDVCRVRRSDFFLAQRITLPSTLASGDYVLKVAVEDLRGAKVAEVSKSFSLSPKTPVAQGR